VNPEGFNGSYFPGYYLNPVFVEDMTFELPARGFAISFSINF